MASEPNEPSTSQHTTNRLALEKSPYLLQHATNVVDWYPWCEEAFEKARKENKLIFLSVGYSTCHWCHVMEKESFENDSVAEIMNRHYISIKVDREERPDIDRVYMSFIQATSGSGGWPMSVFLTPNLEPITGGTYFPPEDKWGRPGFKTILNNIAEKWENEKSSITESGKNILAILKRASEKDFSSTGECAPPGLECVQRCLQQFCKSYEHEYGGFSDSPKFPQPSNFDFLFHVYSRDSESVTGKQCLNMCLHTLKCMANGGIHDHVSNGFARYSTDSRWHVPHFEKMLYDQGQLAVSYCNAYVATKDPFYADIVRDILLYVSRDLSHEEGGFYSAEDADSFPVEGATHKREGAFCVWEYDEIIHHVQGRTGGVANAEIFCYHFNVKKAGNVHPSQDPHNELEKKNVLICYGSIESTAGYFEMTVEDIRDSIDKSLKMLYDVRQKRPRPHLDSKMLTAWNGLMISGFARAGYFLKDDTYISRAIKAAEFIRKYLYQEADKSLIRCCYRASDGQVVQK